MPEQTELLPIVFHADLTDALPGEDYWLVVGGRRIRMLVHTDETRAKLLGAAPHLARHGSNTHLTHYSAESVGLPTNKVVRVHLKHTLRNFPDAKGEAGVSHSALYIPPSPERLSTLSAHGGPVHLGSIGYLSTAQTMLFHHQDVITDDPELAEIIHDLMEEDPNISAEINKLAFEMRRLGQPTEKSGWARLEPFTPYNQDYKPADPKNNPYDGTHTFYMQQPTEDVQVKALSALSPLLIAINNHPKFQDKKWSVQAGQSVDSQDGPKQLQLAARIETTLGENWQAAVAVKSAISALETSLEVKDAGKKQIKLTLKNTAIRYLGGYIQFYDAKGSPLAVKNWYPDDGLAKLYMDGLGWQTDSVRFLGRIRPVNSFMGIPIFADPGELQVTVTFPPGAVSASVYGSGLGIGDNPWPVTPALGGTMTGIFNLGVPSFMLGFSVAAQSYKPLYDILDELGKDKAFVTFVAGAAAGYFGGSSAAQQKVDFKVLSSIVKFLFNKAVTKALVWVEETTAGELAAEQIPFAGWIMIAINIATGLAQMAQTIVAVATSAWNIENKVATTITTNVTVHPDPRNKAFPQGDPRSYTVKMIYKDQKQATVSQTHDVPKGSTATTLPAAFPGNTLGGEAKFEVDFYVDSWLAGKATTGWMSNDDATVSDVHLYLVQYPVPLTEDSVYKHSQLRVYQNDRFAWMATDKAPAGTIANRNTSPSGNAIGDWTGVTLSQRFGMIGLSWQADGMGIKSCTSGAGGQLYAMQNVNIPGTAMDSVKFPSCGFEGPTRLVYDPYPPKFLMVDGQWKLDPQGLPLPDPNSVLLGEYYIDPHIAALPPEEGGGYHLRKVKLDRTTPFDMSQNQKSWGRFAYFPDSVALHPSGNAIGVSAQYHKLQVVKIAEARDIDTPVGRIGAGPATDKTRPGLLFRPVGVTCSYDGTILVLEDTKSDSGSQVDVVSRISAYDLYINPVNRFFDDSGKPSPWLYLSNAPDYHYLDLAAVGDEKMTYIYVLYYIGDGSKPSQYHMAIYQYGLTKPKRNPLVVTDSISVVRIAVDMWHTAYTLNFDMVTDGKGNPAGPKGPDTGTAGRTVPSVSMWLPPVPKLKER